MTLFSVGRALTCVGPEVSLEVGAFGVCLGASGIFTAVDGWPLLPHRPAPTFALHGSLGQKRPYQQSGLVQGQVADWLAVAVVTKKTAVVGEVRDVVVVLGVRGHSLRRKEPVFSNGPHRVLLWGVIWVKVPERDLAVTSSAEPFYTAFLGRAKRICTRKTGERPSWLVVTVITVIQLWLDSCVFGCGQEPSHEAVALLVFIGARFLVGLVEVDLGELLVNVCIQTGLRRRALEPVRQ